jgi:hypothetical protein
MTTRAFHLGDILSITTGRLVAPSGVGAIYEVMDYMTGDSLFTHQLPRAMDECAPDLLRQHPDLANVAVPADFGDDPQRSVADWLNVQIERYGEYREVAPLASADHTHVNPLDELAMNYPNVKVITVEMPAADHG